MLPSQAVSPELARHLCEVSLEINRQVGVLISRDGSVQRVIVGTASGLEIPEIGRLRGGPGRFRGLRLIHTHLSGEALSADDLNDLALLRLDLVGMVQVLEDGRAGAVEVAHVLPSGGAEEPFRRIQAATVYQLDFDVQATVRALEEEFSRLAPRRSGRIAQERALILGISGSRERLAEVAELVASAGVRAVHTMGPLRGRVHPRTVVGKGQLSKIVLESMRLRADAAIFDIDLKPAQARAFEDATGLKAVDRTQLILDIFAQRARSRDGKLQVELAQLKYSLPRLTRQDANLSRLSGGIGGRGPGETVLEIGRRRVRDRIRALERQIGKLSRQRDVRRNRRRRQGLPVLSLIGYTNAGKSTLLNALTNSQVAAADQLFVTLDPSSRRLRFPRRGEVIVTDTVGFLADLPADLVNAFRATLEELEEAHLLLHVIDVADPRLERQMAAVESLLEQLGLDNLPRLRILNKSDLIPEEQRQSLQRRYDGVAVSASNRTGLENLLDAAEKCLSGSIPRPPAAGHLAEPRNSGRQDGERPER